MPKATDNQIDNARSLRKRLTPQEVKIWVKLRELRPLGLHFRRQVPIGGYIVDFACLRSRLVVEVDGGQHGMDEGAARDAVRDAALKVRGYRIVRFWNSDVDRNLNGVVETILLMTRPHPARESAPPSPKRGGIERPRRMLIPPREGRVDGPQGQPGGVKT